MRRCFLKPNKSYFFSVINMFLFFLVHFTINSTYGDIIILTKVKSLFISIKKHTLKNCKSALLFKLYKSPAISKPIFSLFIELSFNWEISIF